MEALKSTRRVREGLAEPGKSQCVPLWEKGPRRQVDLYPQWGTNELISASNARAWEWDGVGVPHSIWAPQSCCRASLLLRGSGPLAGRPSGDPINQTRLS